MQSYFELLETIVLLTPMLELLSQSFFETAHTTTSVSFPGSSSSDLVETRFREYTLQLCVLDWMMRRHMPRPSRCVGAVRIGAGPPRPTGVAAAPVAEAMTTMVEELVLDTPLLRADTEATDGACVMISETTLQRVTRLWRMLPTVRRFACHQPRFCESSLVV